MTVQHNAARMIGTRLPLKQTEARSLCVGGSLVLIASLFNILLCFVSTKGGLNISTGLIANISFLIVAIGAAEAYKTIRSATIYIYSLSIIACIAELKILNTGLDLRIIFDLSICVIFYFLGRHARTNHVEVTMDVLVTIVLIISLIEWLLPDFFQSLFNVWDYYVAKGALGSDTVNYSDTSFAINGVRSADIGRTMLPWLFGVHRISSVFLEPVSMGNFAIVCLIWSLCLGHGRKRIGYICISLFLIILPDSRYALFTGIMIIFTCSFKLDRHTALLSWLPLLALGFLYGWGMIVLRYGEMPSILSDDLHGRLEFSAKLLASWTALDWLALTPSPVYTADTGYAYLINNLGLPLSLAVFVLLRCIQARTSSEARFKSLFYIYVSTSLCVGASLFSIKTAGLLWFLFGAMRHAAEARRSRSGVFSTLASPRHGEAMPQA